MRGGRTALRRVARRHLRGPRGRALFAAAFLLFAAAAALLELGRIQSEKRHYLYYPEGWALRSPLRRSPLRREPGDADIEGEGQGPAAVGGGALGVLPLDIKLYRVREGDTFSGIAERFGLDLDTVASINREWGRGVHLLRVGEAIKIPNQNGIFLRAGPDLEGLCSEKEVPCEVVLQVNRVGRGQVAAGTELFFPGVQHTGIERSVVTGTAFLRPVAGWLSSRFGYRRDPFSDAMHYHRGVDLAAPLGSAVRAALDGKVVAVSYDSVLGNYVLLRHQIGYSSLYGHLQQVLVRPGASVSRGQKIGTVGSTGKSTGPHLHFEVRKNGVPINAWGLMSSRL
jgi:murein DD-endopeptidase MepM/ murein hydrolase activator NlpD